MVVHGYVPENAGACGDQRHWVPRTGGRDGCELPWVLGIKLGSFEEQQVP